MVTVSQAQRGGQWNELGGFAFDGGQDYAITLSDEVNATVVADAVYIVKVEEVTDTVTWAPVLPASGGTYQVYASGPPTRRALQHIAVTFAAKAGGSVAADIAYRRKSPHSR